MVNAGPSGGIRLRLQRDQSVVKRAIFDAPPRSASTAAADRSPAPIGLSQQESAPATTGGTSGSIAARAQLART